MFLGDAEKLKHRNPDMPFCGAFTVILENSLKSNRAEVKRLMRFVFQQRKKGVRVAIYEAAIDAMAHMTLEDGKTLKHRLVLGGISAPKEGQTRRKMKKPVALEHFLAKQAGSLIP